MSKKFPVDDAQITEQIDHRNQLKKVWIGVAKIMKHCQGTI